MNSPRPLMAWRADLDRLMAVLAVATEQTHAAAALVATANEGDDHTAARAEVLRARESWTATASALAAHRATVWQAIAADVLWTHTDGGDG